MKRKEKITMLKAIAAGNKTVEDLLGAETNVWFEDKDNPGMIYRHESGKLIRKKQTGKDLVWHEVKQYEQLLEDN